MKYEIIEKYTSTKKIRSGINSVNEIEWFFLSNWICVPLNWTIMKKLSTNNNKGTENILDISKKEDG